MCEPQAKDGQCTMPGKNYQCFSGTRVIATAKATGAAGGTYSIWSAAHGVVAKAFSAHGAAQAGMAALYSIPHVAAVGALATAAGAVYSIAGQTRNSETENFCRNPLYAQHTLSARPHPIKWHEVARTLIKNLPTEPNHEKAFDYLRRHLTLDIPNTFAMPKAIREYLGTHPVTEMNKLQNLEPDVLSSKLNQEKMSEIFDELETAYKLSEVRFAETSNGRDGSAQEIYDGQTANLEEAGLTLTEKIKPLIDVRVLRIIKDLDAFRIRAFGSWWDGESASWISNAGPLSVVQANNIYSNSLTSVLGETPYECSDIIRFKWEWGDFQKLHTKAGNVIGYSLSRTPIYEPALYAKGWMAHNKEQGTAVQQR